MTLFLLFSQISFAEITDEVLDGLSALGFVGELDRNAPMLAWAMYGSVILMLSAKGPILKWIRALSLM